MVETMRGPAPHASMIVFTHSKLHLRMLILAALKFLENDMANTIAASLLAACCFPVLFINCANSSIAFTFSFQFGSLSIMSFIAIKFG